LSSITPGTSYHARIMIPALLNRHKALHPMHDRRVRYRQPTLGHDLHQSAIAQVVVSVPTHTQGDDIKCRLLNSFSKLGFFAVSSSPAKARSLPEFEVCTKAPTTISGTVLISYAAANAASAAVSFGIMAWTERMLVILSSRIVKSSIYSRETALPVSEVVCRISSVMIVISDTASMRRPPRDPWLR
jgi:hypothetical protein